MTCGIYCITNNINGKQYVGQSVDIEERFNQHIYAKSNSKIHQAIEKYGEHNFRFEPLVRCSPEELDEQEVKFIRLLGTYENGYNQTRGGQHSVFNIEYSYQKYSELKKEVKNKNERILSLKNDKDTLKREIKELHSQIDCLKNDNDSLNTKLILLSKQNKLQKDKIKSLRESNTDLKKAGHPSFKKEWNSMQNKIKRLTSDIELVKSEKIELYFENERLRKMLGNNTLKNNIFEELLEC